MSKYLNKKFLKLIILGALALAVLLPTQKPTLLSPLPEEEKDSNQSISYYITTSQEFLNKARQLANNPPTGGQTPEDKQKIIATIYQSLDLANQAIATYPQDDRSYSQRANIYAALIPFLPDSAKFAIQDLKEATKINKQNPVYYSQLANLYFTTGDFENAALFFYNAHQLSPIDVQIIYRLADSLEKSGQLPKAQYYLDKLISLLPADDNNLPVIQSRRQHLENMLSQARLSDEQAHLQYLTEPGTESIVPRASAEDNQPIFGTQELPIEQAALAKAVIIASNQETNVSSQDQPVVTLNAKSGEATLLAGTNQITITNKNVANNQQIIITPLSKTQGKVLTLISKKASSDPEQPGWFKVGIDTPIEIDIQFTWWIVD